MNGLYQIPGASFTALCHALIIYYMSEHKYPKKKFIFYGFIFAVCFVGLASYGFLASGLTVIFTYIGIVVCTFSFSCIVSRDCFPKKCFLFITYFCLFSVFDNSMKLIVQLVLPQISEPAAYYVALVLRNVALLLFLMLYKKYAVETLRALADISSRRWWNLALTALLFYLVQAVLGFVNGMAVIPPMSFLLVFVVISLTMCVVYSVVLSTISYMKKDVETALVRQNAEYLSAQLSNMQNAAEVHRRLRHDIHHHLEMIAEYAKAGDAEAVLAYIREYNIGVSETAVKQYSINRTVNMILSVYAGKAEESGITFSARCNAPAELTVRDIDLIALLGNLLENALHGCQKSGKKQPCIDIHIRMQNSRLIIVCDNTCSDNLKLSGNLPAGKSVGISSILTVCRKYDGNLDYNIENGICSVCAVLNL